MRLPVEVFVINLDRSPDRLAFMRSQTRRAGIDFTRIAAVDGLRVPPDLADLFAHIRQNKRPIIDDGAIGCYASHLRVYQRMRDTGIPAALVLEDDVELPADLAGILEELLAALPQGWDFVHLAHKPTHAVRPLAVLHSGARLVRYSRIPPNAAGYLISNAGARKLLNPEIPRYWAVDLDTRRPWIFGHDAYGVDPAPIRPLAMPTTIERHRRSVRHGLPRPTRFSWTNFPFLTPSALAFNLRQLGPVWWARCFATNFSTKFRRMVLAPARPSRKVPSVASGGYVSLPTPSEKAFMPKQAANTPHSS